MYFDCFSRTPSTPIKIPLNNNTSGYHLIQPIEYKVIF